MKFFLSICVIAVVGALAAPFFLQVGGKPVMTVDDVINDATPAALQTPTQIYKWQDAQGHWHFGEQPPADQPAQTLDVQDKIIRMEDGWHGEPLTQPDRTDVKFQTPGIAAYADGGRALMEQATVEVERLNERTEKLEKMRSELR